ncbi:MAG TPA: LytTR family DNA-binding domain-containing protein [Puia sp.]|nr:LytTR family DNA-binding domain-containing protein [Puia sp.]
MKKTSIMEDYKVNTFFMERLEGMAAGPDNLSGGLSDGERSSVKERAAASPEKDLILQLDASIFVKNNWQFVKIALQDILYIEADNNYVNLWTPERKFALRVSLAQLQEKIRYKKLVRIHRGYIINIDRLSSFSDGEVWLGKIQLPLGRNYREDFLSQFHFK